MSKELLIFVNKLHDHSLELLRGVTFDKRLEADGYIVCLYASMVELCGGIVTLVERDKRTALSAVFRTFLEAYVDLRNILEDPAYIKNCYALHHKNWIRALRNSEDPNPYLAGIRDHADYDAVLQRHESELQRLKDEGFPPMKIVTRFEKVGMANEYRSVYHFESDGSHNSLQALISRHIEMGENGFGLALYKERSLHDYQAVLDSTAGLLMDATQRIHEHLRSGQTKEIEALAEELSQLRGTYTRATERVALQSPRVWKEI
jgi:hypothetical protein